jgi:hypothetical protein
MSKLVSKGVLSGLKTEYFAPKDFFLVYSSQVFFIF